MAITDELRNWASIEVPYKYGNQLIAIADRIDAKHECDSKPCIDLGLKMAVPKEMQTDYGMMVTANLLMACSIETLKRKNDQLQSKLHELEILVDENTKLQELVCELLTDPDAWDYDYFKWRMHELGIKVKDIKYTRL